EYLLHRDRLPVARAERPAGRIAALPWLEFHRPTSRLFAAAEHPFPACFRPCFRLRGGIFCALHKSILSPRSVAVSPPSRPCRRARSRLYFRCCLQARLHFSLQRSNPYCRENGSYSPFPARLYLSFVRFVVKYKRYCGCSRFRERGVLARSSAGERCRASLGR